ncbi:MAG: rod shape-determining protein MreD [Defluviitaleaceae bacterium]|nr:rod shape-determining protein MreD [Defluviitaleaceae bacterium]
MLRIFAMTVLILINFTLQATLFPHLAILGVTPDTALVFIVSYGILRDEIEGAFFGFFAGLAHDMLSGVVIGLFALLGFLTGYVCGKPFKNFFKDNYFLPFFVVIAVSLVYQFALYVFTILFTGQFEFWHYFTTIILPKTIYTASLSIPLYSFLYFINTRIERHEENSRSVFRKKTEKDDAE